ncbi:M17 family metallopeptidase [Cohnella sp. WQ 127256]|uniref:leucyl aminopeptidase family protein n=1 Tax=Cohnella sp. WQ 127256 TaxID=2938790 RepID=UPI002118C78D|nr:leucyl aminopeptidase family protein [Cohnella sp. WQ 127256]
MNITITGRDSDTVAVDNAEIILHLVMDGEDTLSKLDFELKPAMTSIGKITFLYGVRGEQHRALVGLGTLAKLDVEQLRRAAGCAARAISREGYRSAAVHLNLSTNVERVTPESLVEAWVEGWLLGGYTFDKYKQHPREQVIDKLLLISESNDPQSFNPLIARSVSRAESTMLARDWCNEPANVMTPSHLVEQVQQLFAERNVETRVFQGEELVHFGMNGLLAVGQGSRHQPALVELTYVTDPSLPLLALVGKGMTFDMGGMNMKTGRDLSEARFDMGGACAVIGALDYLVCNEARANVVALIAIADNVPGSGALLPSSTVRYANGLTVQVSNTDAEGRLILADALLHAERLGADEIIDIATLTGSVGHALGLRVAGVWGDRSCTEKLHSLGELNGDRVWPMPLIDDDEDLLRSDYADLSNISSSAYGGANAAALFLRRFVDDSIRWTHIDMANTVQSPADRGYEAAGATGFGVRLLADYVIHYSTNR